MEQEEFRQDLFYRLNVIRIYVPRLAERREDIPPLVDHFIRKYNQQEGKHIAGISAEAMNLLMQYPFPGNIRELENVIERAVVFCDGNDIRTADLPLVLKETREQELPEEGVSLIDKVSRLEKWEIKKALKETGGVKSRAARRLGITERMLSYKIKTYEIDFK